MKKDFLILSGRDIQLSMKTVNLQFNFCAVATSTDLVLNHCGQVT